MVWRVERRGWGERMIDNEGDKMTCLGYASVLDQRNTMGEWLTPLERDPEGMTPEGRRRLIELQHLLLKLVRRLDQNQTRYPFEMEEA
jgi:hypothetical protein